MRSAIRRQLGSKALAALVTGGVVGGGLSAGAAANGCVFELGEVVQPGAGGALGGGGGGAGGSGGSGGSGGDVAPHRTRITIDASSASAPVDDFPLLVTLDPNRIDYAAAGPDGEAVRFYAADGATLLAHEIERWTPSGTSVLWVRVPDVPAGAEVVLWMHVGEADAPAALPSSSVWSAYEGVYHLADPLPGATVRDASPNGRHGAPVMMDAANVADARIGQGYVFDGSAVADPHIDLGSDAAFQVPPDGALTVGVWWKRTAADSPLGVLMGVEGCCLGWGMTLLGPPLQFRSLVGITNCCSGAPTYAYAQYGMPGGEGDDAWHHTVAVMDRQGGLLTSYLDGVEQVAVPIVASTEQHQGALRVGAGFAGEDGFDGLLDELRFERGVPAPARIALEHATIGGDAVSYGSPEPLP